MVVEPGWMRPWPTAPNVPSRASCRPGPQGPAARPPRRRAAAGDDRRAGRRGRAHGCPPRTRVAGAVVQRVGRLRVAGALPRDLRPHGGGDADRRRAAPGGPRVRRSTWPRTASSTPRSATPPSSTSQGGLSSTQVVEAVRDGFVEGQEEAGATAGRSSCASCSPRCGTRPARREIAELAVAYRDQGVVGFDIAGAEAGYPPTRHLDAFEYLQRENAHFTIHAGEAFGLPSIWQAIQWCGADRLGHGVRIIDDIDGRRRTARRRSAGWRRTCGTSGSRWRCAPSSNIQTGAAASIAEHPIGLLTELRFRVTVNTDNRLMSGTSMTAGDGAARRRVRLRPARPAVVHGQRDEVGVHPLRPAARHHRRA